MGGGQKKLFSHIEQSQISKLRQPTCSSFGPGSALQSRPNSTVNVGVARKTPEFLVSLCGLPGNNDEHYGRCGENALCSEEAQMGKERVDPGEKLVPTDVPSLIFQLSPPRCAAAIKRSNRSLGVPVIHGAGSRCLRTKMETRASIFQGEN